MRRKEIERNQPLLVRDRLFFKARNALVEMTNRLFERGDGSDERTEDVGHRLEAGVNFCGLVDETLPDL